VLLRARQFSLKFLPPLFELRQLLAKDLLFRVEFLRVPLESIIRGFHVGGLLLERVIRRFDARGMPLVRL